MVFNQVKHKNNMKINYSKNLYEKYTLEFNNGWDYAVFLIDSNGSFSCQSSFGDYYYKWNLFGNDFKKFLCSLDSEYLFKTLCDRTYFDTKEYIKKCKKIILKLRRNQRLIKKDAMLIWDFLDKELDGCDNSIEMVCNELANSEIMKNIYIDDIFYSEFCPKYEFSPDEKTFITYVYPKFVEVLKEEFEVENLKFN
ncbi:TPA: hypothetical protein KQG29_001497 [Clostridioides difficile]|nr:hypothetical protein [Clostridioides difficile]